MSADYPKQRPWWKTPYGVGLSVFLCVAAFFLVTEHWAHVIPYLPFVLFLLCPLTHIFMHVSHEDSHHQGQDAAHGQSGKGLESRDARDITRLLAPVAVEESQSCRHVSRN